MENTPSFDVSQCRACRSCGGLPGVVFVSSGAYDTGRVTTAVRQQDGRSMGRTGHGEARLNGPDGGSPDDGGSHGELFECHHADTSDARFPFYRLRVLPIPADVQRIVVLYPRGGTPEWSSAYSRLEGQHFS